jgi:ATP-dependent Clp protease protease subunit
LTYYRKHGMNSEIYLHSDEADSEDNGINFKVASKFLKRLHEAEQKSTDKIIAHTSTIGGEWADGMSIFDNISYSSLPVYMIGHGCLCSMGTIILQAASKRYLMPNCDIMVHFGDLTLSGHQVSVESGTKYYIKVKNQMIDIYTDKCIKGSFFKDRSYSRARTKAYIKRKLESSVDWYMSAQEAVDFGFADKVLTRTEYLNVREIKKRNNRGTK